MQIHDELIYEIKEDTFVSGNCNDYSNANGHNLSENNNINVHDNVHDNGHSNGHSNNIFSFQDNSNNHSNGNGSDSIYRKIEASNGSSSRLQNFEELLKTCMGTEVGETVVS